VDRVLVSFRANTISSTMPRLRVRIRVMVVIRQGLVSWIGLGS
jgi:hypothetical protein